MMININTFSPGDDDANYDENDAVWQEEEQDELDEFGFKTEGEEEEEEVEKEEKTDENEESEDDEEEDEDDDEEEGFGLEKDV